MVDNESPEACRLKADRFDRWDRLKDRWERKGKPSRYRVHVLGLGRVGYNFSRCLLEEMRYDPALDSLYIWHRVKPRISEGKVIDTASDDRSEQTFLRLIEIMTEDAHLHRRPRHILKNYRKLPELEEIASLSASDKGTGDILVVTSRYDMDLSRYSSGEKALLERLLDSTVWDVDGGYDKAFRRLEDRVNFSKALVQKVKVKGLDPNRSDNLMNSIPGISELAKVFAGRTLDRLNVIMATNEVDTTGYIFQAISGLSPGQVVSLCHNDQLRFESFFSDLLPASMRSYRIDAPVLGTHNEFITPVSAAIRIDGKPFWDFRLTIRPEDIELIRRKTAAFGLKVYDKLKSSDQDTAKALVQICRSIMYEDASGLEYIRAGANYPGHSFFTGFPVRFDSGKAMPYRLTELLDQMEPHEREIFRRGNDMQQFITEELKKEGIIGTASFNRQTHTIEAKKPDRIYCISTDRNIYSWDVVSPLTPLKAVECMVDGSEATPTAIRGVRHKGKELLLIGHKGGINIYNPALEFLFSQQLGNSDARLGQVNSIAYHEGRAYCSFFLKGESDRNSLTGIYEADLEPGHSLVRSRDIESGYLAKIGTDLVFVSGLNLYSHGRGLIGTLDNIVTAIHSGKDRILIGDQYGTVSIYDGGRMESIFIGGSSISAVSSFELDRAGYTLVGTRSGRLIGYLGKDKVFEHHLNAGDGKNEIFALSSTNGDAENVFVATSRYLARIPVSDLFKSTDALCWRAVQYNGAKRSILAVERFDRDG